jgi:hypothetical protein
MIISKISIRYNAFNHNRKRNKTAYKSDLQLLNKFSEITEHAQVIEQAINERAVRRVSVIKRI